MEHGRISFKDHFSSLASEYRQFRPRYPGALFAYLAQNSPGRERAWDCGCGSGQGAVGLAPHFAQVVATDASAEQIGRAVPHPRILYRVAAAEQPNLPPRSVDLIFVGQALHWFSLDAFYAAAKKIIRSGGLLAVCGYGWLSVAPHIDPVLAFFYSRTLGPFWPPERRLLDEGYRNLPLPFEELSPPTFTLRAEWTLAQLLGYVDTWSALKLYRAETGNDPLAHLAGALRRLWGDPERKRVVTWPLFLRVSRAPGMP